MNKWSLNIEEVLLSRTDYIVLSAVMELQEGNVDEIKEIMADYSNRRTTKQPLNFPSAGSTFKRPEGHFAAKLIDDCGLRGLTLRGAQVSDKHCGFVINIRWSRCKSYIRFNVCSKKYSKCKIWYNVRGRS